MSLSEQQCWVFPSGMEALESEDVGLHLTGSYYSIGTHAQKEKKRKKRDSRKKTHQNKQK